jgi:hypothetical protein
MSFQCIALRVFHLVEIERLCFSEEVKSLLNVKLSYGVQLVLPCLIMLGQEECGGQDYRN